MPLEPNPELHIPSPSPTRVRDVEEVLDRITGGRISAPPGPDNPWHVVKSSGLAGKSVIETPGLVTGDPDAVVRRLAVAMSMTEHHIELARAMGVDLIVAHHPVADAASSGGVPLTDYLAPYGVSVIECHEAFHGLHPGIAFLHGHEPFHHDGAFGGVHGKVVMVGRPLDEVTTLGDLVARVRTWLNRDVDERVLLAETTARGAAHLVDSATAPGLQILAGDASTPVGPMVLHAFPHTGFGPADLDAALAAHPGVTTLVLSISGANADGALVRRARALGLGVVVGSSHASEILENGLPLAFALERMLPDVEVTLFRDRVVALPLSVAAPGRLGEYAHRMADHLLHRTESRLDREPSPATEEVVL
ncbi:MAG TPA: Nif3-like dinuclear metal center hexameric protein [Actinomycetales bacterium]|nr:Nif3-like dinuclear metal center hexameric protein [Actinomycetales bacterium]